MFKGLNLVVMEERPVAIRRSTADWTIHLLTAHRDQSSLAISGWFPGSGVSLRTVATPSQACGPVVSRCDLNSTTVAGAAPGFDRLPNSPLHRHEAAPEMSSSNHDSGRPIGMKATSHPCGATPGAKTHRPGFLTGIQPFACHDLPLWRIGFDLRQGQKQLTVSKSDY